MKYLPKRNRGGFTLIELLIVITIIVILVSLLLVGINYAFITVKRTGASSDIKQLDASLQGGFKGKYGVYPPSRIRLCTNYARYALAPTPAANGGVQLDTDSIAFINRMWPNIGAFSGINWAGNGTVVDEILEGDQCLVFFLGGIPNPVSPATNPQTFNDSLGFAKNNPKDPSAVSAASPGQTFFAFSSDRVYVRNTSSNVNTTFASYKDYFGQQPYLYFSAYNRKNGYAPLPLPSYAVPILGVQPYFSAANQFHNPDTYQIICAGADGAFGLAKVAWTPATAETVYPASSQGKDDQTNFYDALMGVSR